jgi:hypothetical protein
MSELPTFVAGLIVGLALGLVIARVRQTETVGSKAFSKTVSGSRSTNSRQAVTPTTVRPDGRRLGLLARLDSDLAGLERDERHVVVSEQMSIQVTPDGLTISLGGQTYHGLAALPPEKRDEIRTLLRAMPDTITDPTIRARVEDELRDAGAV